MMPAESVPGFQGTHVSEGSGTNDGNPGSDQASPRTTPQPSSYVVRVPCNRGIFEMRARPSSPSNPTDDSSEQTPEELELSCRGGLVKFIASNQSISHAIKAGEIDAAFIRTKKGTKKGKNLPRIVARVAHLPFNGDSIRYDVQFQWHKRLPKDKSLESKDVLVSYATQVLYKKETLILQMHAKSFKKSDSSDKVKPPSGNEDSQKNKGSDEKPPELLIPCRDGFAKFIASDKNIRRVIESGGIKSSFVPSNKVKDPQCRDACTVDLPGKGGSTSYELILKACERRPENRDPEYSDPESQQERLSSLGILRGLLSHPGYQAVFMKFFGGWIFLRPDEDELLEYITYGLLATVPWAGVLGWLFGVLWQGETEPLWYGGFLAPTGLIFTAFLLKCTFAKCDRIPSLCHGMVEVVSLCSMLFLIALSVIALSLGLPAHPSGTTN